MRHASNPATSEIAGFPAWLTVPFTVLFEILMIVLFSSELVELRKADGSEEVVALTTFTAAGKVFFQPNYAINDQFNKAGAYQLFGQEAVRIAIDRDLDFVNVMPTCGSAKATLGLKALPADSLDSCLQLFHFKSSEMN